MKVSEEGFLRFMKQPG